ncbi:MAG TPA: TolC family protein [Candidatus Sulfotelmatobacter sp.]|nr:TolC family protein [Candidatus Sulfotelmatobacter sp.]
MKRRIVVGLGLILLGLLGGTEAQQASSPLTLQQAVKIALEKNPARKAALADAHAASAQIKAAQSYLLPHVSFSETATRGNDPVYVFGSRLRQQSFTAANFALNELNRPRPFGNFATRLEGRWNLFNSFASWRGLSQAKLMDEAAAQQLNRAEQEIVFHVIAAYNEVLLSAKQLELAAQTEKTARAIVERSQSRFESGLVVESDLLTAKVRLASRQQELIRARNGHDLALARLNSAMGVPVDANFQLAQELSERALPAPVLADLETQASMKRPDLKRIAAEGAAQQQAVAIARSAFGPQVNAFAGWELDNPTLLAGGGGNNWAGGIEVKFDLFEGGARRAEISRQKALQEKVNAIKQMAADAVRLEVRQAYYDVDSNRQQVEVARASIAQAQDSLRINQDRYESGLITITDLLGAEDAARRSQNEYWEAVSRFHTSYANLELASGALNPQSAVVMP